MSRRRIILSNGLMAALVLATGEATAQNFRSRFPTRPATPVPQGNPSLVTPFSSSFANPNFSNFRPSVNNFNPGYNNPAPFANPAFNNYNYGNFSPFASPYGYNQFATPYNSGFYPGLSPFATPFNPFFGNGMYNPYLGY